LSCGVAADENGVIRFPGALDVQIMEDDMVSLFEASAGPQLPKALTGIGGLDEITEGGLPRGRSTLVTGGTGCGKTLMGVQFLVTGAREHGEPGVLVTFEESAEEIAANVASLGFDLDGLQKDRLLAIYAFRAEPTEVVGTGAFNFEPLFLLLDDAIKQIGARRVVLDSIEALFGMFQAQPVVRAELGRLFRWLKDHAVTAIVTGERDDSDALTRHGIEEFVSDCVIALDHHMRDGVATRRLHVVKYRGSAHETNQYPFLISARGIEVQPITAVGLEYDVSDERVSTGVPRLDYMLSGGLFRGSTVLVSGAAGTGKSTLGAHLIDAACARGERALLILHEESAREVMRNMRSIGLDLERWVQAGLLRVWAARPTAYGLENHLAIVSRLVEEHAPAVAVVDGIGSLVGGPSLGEVSLMLARQFHLFKTHGITALATVVTEQDDETAMGVSSRADTWLLLRNVESDGERNRLLFVLKSRGTAHSNQVREFVVTGHGVQLIDVYVGPEGMVTGSARLAQEIAERDARLQQQADAERRTRELRQHNAQLQEEIAANEAELKQIADRQERLTADAQTDRQAMGTQRWADPDEDDDKDQR
jgi:circadian clock protein KaiC